MLLNILQYIYNRVTGPKMSIVPRVRKPAHHKSVSMHVVALTENPTGRDLNQKDFYYLLDNKGRAGAEKLWCADQ